MQPAGLRVIDISLATSQNVTKKERAAVLLAEDELSDELIAAGVGVSRQTLARWKKQPDFAAHVGDNVGRIQAGMLKLAIAKKHKRLQALDTLHDKALQVIHDRAARHAEELRDADSPVTATKRLFGDNTPAEAATGLLVKQESVNNSGMKTVNWAVDTRLIKEIRALHEQAAKELGQWIEKGEKTQNVNVRIMAEQVIQEYGVDFGPDEVIAETQRLLALASGQA